MSQPVEPTSERFDPVSGAAADANFATPDVTTHPKTGKNPPQGEQLPTPPSAPKSTKGRNHY